MSHQFDAAIKILDDAVVNNKTSAMYRPAQRFLEAGKGVDALTARATLAVLSAESSRVPRNVNESIGEIRALLSALPDKEGGK